MALIPEDDPCIEAPDPALAGRENPNPLPCGAQESDMTDTTIERALPARHGNKKPLSGGIPVSIVLELSLNGFSNEAIQAAWKPTQQVNLGTIEEPKWTPLGTLQGPSFANLRKELATELGTTIPDETPAAPPVDIEPTPPATAVVSDDTDEDNGEDGLNEPDPDADPIDDLPTAPEAELPEAPPASATSSEAASGGTEGGEPPATVVVTPPAIETAPAPAPAPAPAAETPKVDVAPAPKAVMPAPATPSGAAGASVPAVAAAVATTVLDVHLPASNGGTGTSTDTSGGGTGAKPSGEATETTPPVAAPPVAPAVPVVAKTPVVVPAAPPAPFGPITPAGGGSSEPKVTANPPPTPRAASTPPAATPPKEEKKSKDWSWLGWLLLTIALLLLAGNLLKDCNMVPSAGSTKHVTSTIPTGGGNGGCEVNIHPIIGHPDKVRVAVDFCPQESLTVWEGVSKDPSCYPGNNSPGYNLSADAKCPARKVVVTGNRAMRFK
jgi:hypothetical protein